jgi:prephenate dehydratase
MSISVGTLGGKATFAGDACARLRERYPALGEPRYFASSEEVWDALANGVVDAIVLGIERTGRPHGGQRLVTHGYFVLGKAVLPLVCNLYVKPGTQRNAIAKIVGHGSIRQCSKYLDENFPGLPREMHPLNSVEAAKAVLVGDGTVAAVGSVEIPSVVPGLETFATGIDDGALCSWWIISSAPAFDEHASQVVVAGTFGPGDGLDDLIQKVAHAGYCLEGIASFPVNRGISVYDYVLSFVGPDQPLSAARAAISGCPNARLAGAFDGF